MRGGAKCLYTGSRPELYTDKRFKNAILTVARVHNNIASCHNLNYYCESCSDYLPELTYIQIHVKDLKPLKPGTLKYELLTLYANLNPDIIAGLQDHITNTLEVNKTITQIVDEYTDKHPADKPLLKEVKRLQKTESISDLESLYEIIELITEV